MALYLGIPPASGIDWGNFPWFGIRKRLLTWLRSCCDAHSHTDVRTISHHHAMSRYDGLVYLVGYASDSVIARVGAPESMEFHIGSTTSLGGEMLSEVYVNASSEFGVAANTYHELLHNKFRLSIDIHTTKDGNFTNATAPYSGTDPSDADQQLMCQALSESARQYQGGFDLPDGN